MDASVVWLNRTPLNAVLQRISSGSLYPVLLFHRTGFSNYEMTHREMLRYFNCSIRFLRSTQQFGSGVMLFIRTLEVLRNVIMPFTYCALDKDCMAPRGATVKCGFRPKKSGKTQQTSRNCHRFDQSAINLILGAISTFNVKKYTVGELDGKMFEVVRSFRSVQQVRDFLYHW